MKQFNAYEDYTDWSIGVGTSSVSIGITNTLVATVSPTRKYLYIRNTSAGGQTVSIAFGTTAYNGIGKVLGPNEGYYEYTEGDFKCWRGVINAISDLAGATISYEER
jgi:hypothetical protein